jgi:hypothetical protein
MSLTSSPARHLGLITEDGEISLPVRAYLEDLDAIHETLCDRYDNATRDLDAARAALTQAARKAQVGTALAGRRGASGRLCK